VFAQDLRPEPVDATNVIYYLVRPSGPLYSKGYKARDIHLYTRLESKHGLSKRGILSSSSVMLAVGARVERPNMRQWALCRGNPNTMREGETNKILVCEHTTLQSS
jgi:hypothetical protein